MNKVSIKELPSRLFKLNPMIKKELTMSVRTPKFVGRILAYNTVLTALALLAYYASFGDIDGYYRSIDYQNIILLYMVISFIQLGLILFSVPSFTAGTIAGEREKQTLDILLTTRLKPMQIILGKLFSSISSVLLLYISSLPILGICFAIGGIEWKSLFYLTIVIICCSIFLGSIGIYFSTKMKKSIPATVVSYAMSAMLVAGTFVLVLIYSILKYVAYGNKEPGASLYLLLINPLMTVIAMMTNQFGSNEYKTILLSGGIHNEFIVDHWFAISLLVQLVIAALLLVRAAHNLNPLHAKVKNKMKKKKKK